MTGHASPEHGTAAALGALLRGARLGRVAQAIAGDAETALLRSVVDAAVAIFEAEAASIALFEHDPERLEFRVAAGAQGAGVVGLSVPPSQGIAGYVFSTGQDIALSDVANDPRFDRATAQRTGYVPRCIAAVPLIDAGSTVGVLQVLDKRDSDTFSLRDMELLGVFARQAAAAIEAVRVSRDSARLLRAMLVQVGGDELSEEDLDALAASATAELDGDDAAPFWGLVERVARMRDLADADVELAGDILDVVSRHRPRARRRG